MHHEMKAKGETRTWNWMGAMIGVMIGGLVAFGGILMLERGTIDLAYGMEASSTAPLVAKIGIPIVLILFGAGAGALLGNGTPRYNAHPEQGRGNAYHFFRRRRRNTPADSQI